MKVLHVIPSVSVKHGGPSVAIKAMTHALVQRGVEVAVATTDDDGPSARLSVPLARPIREENCTYFYFRRNLLPYKISFGLADWVKQNVRHFDVIHVHALFSFASVVAARAARKQKVPYIVRPLGVLNRWGMQNRRRIPKLISFRAVELPLLRGCSAIHYTSESERMQAAALSPELAEHRCAVIPLAVEPLSKASSENLPIKDFQNRQIILFLSRIDPMKGLDLLLEAFAIVREKHPDVLLVVAGEGDPGYVKKLQALPTALDNAQNIRWLGYLEADAKAAVLSAATVFVLPSSSENFGVAAAESLAAGIPTIVSEEVGLSIDVARYQAGLVVKRQPRQIAEAICTVLTDRARRETLAANGVQLARERYSTEAVGRALHELYQEIVRG